MNEPYLIRARLRRDAAAAAIAALLVPAEPNARMGAAHRLIWSLLTDGPDRTRDFLWRETAPGAYLALAARPPTNAHDLFHVECKRFAPKLREGQRLGFNLRANPVVSSAPEPGRKRGRRRDVMMHALHPVPKQDRPAVREGLVRQAATAWLTQQGELHGFEPDPARLRLDAHDQVRLPRADQSGGDRRPIAFSVVTLEGVLTVRDPSRFGSRLLQGFGAAKAFGCGLMLIRPAPAAAETDDLA